ncbi:hypothetical protein CDAR_373531 [Caerostris darwini]|uniref:Uncharacterized protein n=1 Tax=Caerostris darwini TaxID=1538125 RepID=A0AAV4QIC7_9ARAC|nr:hypothetical protein CDAR_373531 [Caerostris darwini]
MTTFSESHKAGLPGLRFVIIKPRPYHKRDFAHKSPFHFSALPKVETFFCALFMGCGRGVRNGCNQPKVFKTGRKMHSALEHEYAFRKYTLLFYGSQTKIRPGRKFSGSSFG